MIDEQEVEQLRTAARAKIVTEARNATLLDAAFAIISHNSSHQRFGLSLGERPLPIDLRVLRDRFAEVEIDDARHRARALLQDAYQAGEDALAGGFRREIVDKLRRRHPGFSDKCYEDTIHQGCFLAR